MLVWAGRNKLIGFGHERGHVTGIQDWLEEVGLEKYAAVFAEHEITLEMLPDLTAPDIDRLALPTGPRRRLMVAIQALRDAARAKPSVLAPDDTRSTAEQSQRR